MNKITMKRLRDYPWNVRLSAILAALALVAGSVIISAEAQAQPVRHHHQHALRAHRAQVEAALDSCERDSEAAECAALEDEFADTYGLGTCELPSEEVECSALERELAREGLWF